MASASSETSASPSSMPLIFLMSPRISSDVRPVSTRAPFSSASASASLRSLLILSMSPLRPSILLLSLPLRSVRRAIRMRPSMYLSLVSSIRASMISVSSMTSFTWASASLNFFENESMDALKSALCSTSSECHESYASTWVSSISPRRLKKSSRVVGPD